MAQFSSKPPFNDDPLPSRNPYDGSRWRDYGGWREMIHDPRPEYDRPQTNPTNPILIDARARGDYEHMLGQLPGLARKFNVGPDAVDHARRVLTRLANFSKED